MGNIYVRNFEQSLTILFLYILAYNRSVMHCNAKDLSRIFVRYMIYYSDTHAHRQKIKLVHSSINYIKVHF